MTIPFTRGLHGVAEGVHAYLQPDGGWGWSNAGLVEGDDASLLVDTLFDLHLTGRMLEAMGEVTARRPIGTLVNTHANGDHCYGNELVVGPGVDIVGLGRDRLGDGRRPAGVAGGHGGRIGPIAHRGR